MDHTDLARWLDPEIRAFIARTDSFYPPTAESMDIADNRRLYDGMCAGFRAPHPADVGVTDDRADAVPIRRYAPCGQPGAATLLYLHGGGFALGGLDSHQDVCAELCHLTSLRVVAADYRLAPEHIYPAALDDAETVYRALAADGPVLVGGDSAGANLAAALCHRSRRLGLARPRGQILIYPSLSRDPLRVAGGRAAEAPMLTASDCALFAAHYAGGAARLPRGDPEFAPLDATSFTGLAPAAIFAAGYDPLAQDAEDYAAVLNAAGVAVSYRRDPGLVHGWLRARHASRLAGDAFAAVVMATRALAEEAPLSC
jgi:acetyl esterase